MRSGQIAFIQDKTFQSDILREKMDKKGFRLWYRSFFATTIPSHCSFCPSCWNGRSGKAKQSQLVCLASAGQEPLQFIRSGGSYLYFLDYDLGRDSPQRRGPCPVDLPHGPRRENRLCYRPWEKGMDILRRRRAALWFIENVWIRMRWFGSIFDI
mgnify:CR=1 FL=1